MRTNELISGVRSDVAVKVYGDDLDRLVSVAAQDEKARRKVAGAEELKAEQATGLPVSYTHLDVYKRQAIGDIVLDRREGVPIRVRDVAMVGEGKELRTGAATQNGHEVVIGTAFMLFGANSREVSKAAAAKLEAANASLPQGVHAKPVYDRTALVDRTITTVAKNLIEGALLVLSLIHI